MRRIPVILAVLVPMGATAQVAVDSREPSYTHVEGGLSIMDPPAEWGGSDIGLRARGSLALDDVIFVRGGLSLHRFSQRIGPPPRRRVSFDRDVLSLGVGFRVPTEQALDLYGAADVIHDFGDADETGFRLEGGAKTVFQGGWDSTGGLRVDYVDSDSYLQLFASTWYGFTPEFSLGGEVAVGDFDELLLGARYRF